MKGLNKSQLKSLATHRTAVYDAQQAFATALARLQDALTAAGKFMYSVADAAQRHYDGGSNRWRESDVGCAYAAWVEDMKDIACGLQAVDAELQDDDAISRFGSFDTKPNDC